MFLRKKYRDADKKILQDKVYVDASDGDAIINIKISDKEQIFSKYNYESDEKLNNDLGEFIYDKARFVSTNKDIRIKVFSTLEIGQEEVESAIKNHYKKNYIETKNEMRRNLIFSIIMLAVGLLAFAFLLVMHKVMYNIYLEIVLEIITWVFIWEAVDSYCLKRVNLRREAFIFLNLYMADIDVVNLKDVKHKEKES